VTSNSKYIGNRNLWRKTYPIGNGRKPPVKITETKLGTDGEIYSVTLDLNKTIRHRDYFKLLGDIGSITNLGEYDEDLIHFNNETLKSFSYNFTFSNDPTVVFSQGTADPSQPNTENLNIFGISKNTTGGVVALSAPYSGTIRYRAAYASVYPSYFTGSVVSILPTAGVFIASVDREVPDNVSYITSSWAALITTAPYMYQTPFDDNLNYDANIATSVANGTLSNSTAIIELSAPMSSSIYILAVQ
jgi:hypothetical protein